MAALNDSLTDSYIGKVGNALGPYTTELTTAGFDPASRIEQLSGAGALIEGAIKVRKAAEKAASAAADAEQKIRNQFYKLSTDTVSLVEGLLSKDHELTVKLRGLRADLIGNQNPGGTPPPPTNPT